MHGDWLYCESCRIAGDPVELAQRAWGEPLAATLEHLARMGIALQQPSAEQVEKYQRDHLDRRQQLERIWDDSRTYHTKNVPRAAQSLFAGLGARGLVRDPYWLARIRPFLGLSDRQQLDDLFFPGAFAGRRRQNHDGRSSYLITPLGSLRVTELPEIDDLAEEADGYMGEVFPELTIPLAAQSERGAYRGHIDQMDDL